MRSKQIITIAAYALLMARNSFGAPSLPASTYKNPSSFTSLPNEIINTLDKMHCVIPQPYNTSNIVSNNVITGQFAKKGQFDVAVLCSAGGNSNILIFWGGPAKCPALHAELEDKMFVYENGHKNSEYYRALFNATKSNIHRHNPEAREIQEGKIEHDGIYDAWVERGSSIHYCLDGHWIKLDGAD